MNPSRFSYCHGFWISVQKLLFLMDTAVMLGRWSTWVCAEAASPQSSTGPWDVNIPVWVVGARHAGQSPEQNGFCLVGPIPALSRRFGLVSKCAGTYRVCWVQSPICSQCWRLWCDAYGDSKVRLSPAVIPLMPVKSHRW